MLVMTTRRSIFVGVDVERACSVSAVKGHDANSLCPFSLVTISHVVPVPTLLLASIARHKSYRQPEKFTSAPYSISLPSRFHRHTFFILLACIDRHHYRRRRVIPPQPRLEIPHRPPTQAKASLSCLFFKLLITRATYWPHYLVSISVGEFGFDMEAFLQPLPVANSLQTRCSRFSPVVNPRRNPHLRLARRSVSKRPIYARAQPPDKRDDDEPTEVERRRENNRVNSARRSLEIGWRFQNMQKDEKPTPCEKCKGTGRIGCDWCHATGVMMLGDRLVCSINGNCSCLLCQGGEVQCKACKGTGMIAPWLPRC